MLTPERGVSLPVPEPDMLPVLCHVNKLFGLRRNFQANSKGETECMDILAAHELISRANCVVDVS